MKSFFSELGKWTVFAIMFLLGVSLFTIMGTIGILAIILGFNLFWYALTGTTASLLMVQIETTMAVFVAMAASIALMLWALREQLRSVPQPESAAPKSEAPGSGSTQSDPPTEESR